MAKYNLFEEFMHKLLFSRDHFYGKGGEIWKQNFDAFVKSPKIRVGNKFVTTYELPSTHGIGDRKVLDLVQDEAGNIIGLRSEIYNKSGAKLSVEKMTPERKSFTLFELGNVRSTRSYDDCHKNYLRYNLNGVNPVNISR